jgi:hypothetical protein
MTVMRRQLVTACLFVLVGLASAGAHGADLAGVWKGTMETQMGPVENTITIEPGELALVVKRQK